MLSPNLIPWLELAKFIFFFSYIVSTIGVIVGVYWERDEFPKDKQDRGWLVLIISLGFDTFFTVLVFSSDGWISAIQREQINAATSELARLETSRELTTDQIAKVASELKNAPKSPVSVALAITDSTDAKAFGESIKKALTEGGFTVVDPPPKLNGILSWSGPGAWLLVHNLKNPPLSAAPIQRAFASVGTYLEGMEKPDDIPDPGVVVIGVSSHPFKPVEVPPEMKKLLADKP